MKLVYTSDQKPGYRRVRRGKGFSYLFPDGARLLDRDEIRRIRSLAVPPAYQNVWICQMPNGHLQATGIDARGRKQYRYHPAWHEDAADRKFGNLAVFVTALPRIRAGMRRELAEAGVTRARVIAGIVALLDLTGYRIGNTRYERENRTFGLSSLLVRHLREEEDGLVLRFRGKSGSEHRAIVSHPRLVGLLTELQDLPGQHLFRYEDDEGELHDIGTADVNDWLKETGGGEYTAKQFRTWRATLLCARILAAEPLNNESVAARNQAVRAAIKATAQQLNHTAATCRKYYIHPALLAAYSRGDLHRIMHAPPPRLRKTDGTAALRADERRVFRILFS